MNNEQKEKKINRDYYLKKYIIHSLTASISFPIFVGLTLLCGVVTKAIFNDEGLGVVVALFTLSVTWFVLAGLAIYYTTKFWKAYKECQEESVNPTLTEETTAENNNNDDRERERERVNLI